MTTAYFAPLVSLPAVITGPGQYRTRFGEVVTIECRSQRHEFGCDGHYPDGKRDSWHFSGRLMADQITGNDVIAPA